MTPAHPTHFDPRDFRNALGAFTTGVTVVTTLAGDGRRVGLTCNSFSSVSITPPLILWSLGVHSMNLPVFIEATHFAVNILAADQSKLSRRFASPVDDRFAGVAVTLSEDGVPLIDGAAAQLECRNEARHYSGDHVIFIGEVQRYRCTGVEPLVFARGKYKALSDL